MDSAHFDTVDAQGRAAAERLLNACFPVPAGQSFFDDFPVWGRVGQDPALRLFALKGADGEFTACAGGRLAKLKLPGSPPLAVGLIGAVATHPSRRGEGLASGAVKEVMAWLSGKGAALILLWGAEHALYERFGFGLCGRQLRIPLPIRGRRPAGRAGGPLKFTEGFSPRILAALRSRPDGLAIEDADEIWMGAHRHVRWFAAESAEGDLLAYAGLGRGIDLGNLVHEWGGEATALADLLDHVGRASTGAEMLAGPSVLESRGFVVDPKAGGEFLCMASIPDPSRLQSALGLSRSGIAFTRADGGWRLDLKGQPIGVLAASELGALFFGPHPAGGLGVPGLPFPLWVWGLDAA